ncbi:MAG: hypothetical protein A2070_13660 [Bdellovibrionales bacterium GWC1_52_8]|nr:MAG: hypothetical protein A2X97_04900 [Bdellovibrionales bacterium GWA1_52_35]OFZ40812.1 MAG: hypothetical protein A2070_13660 [Bdellovibrionales bacterium GWC1_52_8]
MAALGLNSVLVSAAWVLPSRTLQQDSQGFYFQPAGVAEDYPQRSTPPGRIREDLKLLSEMGVQFLRVGIAWTDIEQVPGKYNWGHWDDLIRLAPQYGVTILPYVCYTPAWLNSDPENPDDHWRNPPKDLRRFADFMFAIAKRYKGKVPSWELWNEPDNEYYWLGDVSLFAQMIREGAFAVMRADPAARLVIGGMAQARGPFLEELLDKFALGSFFDVVSVHGYLETWDGTPAESYPQRLQDVRDLMKDTRASSDLWLAEFGYSNFRLSDRKVSEWVEAVYDYEHTPIYQAVSLWKHHVLARAADNVSLTTWYRTRDLPTNEVVIGDANNRFLGLLDTKGQKKPAFSALKLYNRLFDQPVRPVSQLKVNRPAASQSVVHAFEKKNGNFILTGWLRSSLPMEVKDKTGRSRDLRTEKISVQLPLTGSAWKLKVYSILGEPSAAKARLTGNLLKTITLRGDRAFIAEIERAEILPEKPAL